MEIIRDAHTEEINKRREDEIRRKEKETIMIEEKKQELTNTVSSLEQSHKKEIEQIALSFSLPSTFRQLLTTPSSSPPPPQPDDDDDDDRAMSLNEMTESTNNTSSSSPNSSFLSSSRTMSPTFTDAATTVRRMTVLENETHRLRR